MNEEIIQITTSKDRVHEFPVLHGNGNPKIQKTAKKDFLGFVEMAFSILFIENGVKLIVQSIHSKRYASKIVDNCLKWLKNKSFVRVED